MKDLSRYINKVPVKVELDTSMEKILAIQLLYKQVIDVMDTIEGGSVINVKSDWNAEAGSESEILNKPDLKTVATSGSYNDLSNKPVIPTTLAGLDDDATHRVVTDTEKDAWNGKADVGTAQDTKDANTVYGAKAFAKNAVDEGAYFQENFSVIASLAIDPDAATVSVITNPEWKIVYTDAEDRIFCGKRQDDSWYFAADLDDIIDAIIDGYGS